MVNLVVIVLGSALDTTGEASSCMMRRVLSGCDLSQKIKDADILMSGGFSRVGIDMSEARKMAEIALAQGIEREHIFVEEASLNTLENAAFCKALIEDKGWDNILVVSDRYHLLRARMAFRSFGIKAKYVSTYRGPFVERVQLLSYFREVPALIWYGFRILNGHHQHLLK